MGVAATLPELSEWTLIVSRIHSERPYFNIIRFD